MVYILAVEDYFIFHDFMYEANLAKSKGRFGMAYMKNQAGRGN